eukprot:521943_1
MEDTSFVSFTSDVVVEKFSSRSNALEQRWPLKKAQLLVQRANRCEVPPICRYLSAQPPSCRQTQNEKRLVLYVPVNPRTLAIEIDASNVTIYRQFVRGGKLTFKFASPINYQVLISCAEYSDLKKVLRFLRPPKPVSSEQNENDPPDSTEAPVHRRHLFTPPRPRKKAVNVRSPLRVLREAPQSFSPDQMRVLEMILDGKNVFVTGSAGSGKSFLLKYIIDSLPPETTYATACTGVAACHIGGSTIFHFAGIGRGDGSPEVLARKIRANREAVEAWRTVRLLIIDEVSMLDSRLYDKLETIARLIRNSSRPFGGIQLLLCGDFFQLPPVSKGSDAKHFCFEADSWRRCVKNVVEMKQVFRQKDNQFVSILNELRKGKCSVDTQKMLKSCVGRRFPRDGILPTVVMTHKAEVDRMNSHQLKKLKGDEVVFEASDRGPASYVTQLRASCTARQEMRLKVGAQVTLIKNMSVSEGLVNGSRGVVTSFQ